MNLVCIHGNSLDSTIFDSINISGFKKIAIDLPGHGKRDLGELKSFSDLVEIVYQEIRHLENVVLLGSSLGGHIAHHLLAKMRPLGILTISAPPLNLGSVSKAFLPNPLSHLLFQQEISLPNALVLAESMLSLKRDNVGMLSQLIMGTNPLVREIIGQSLMRGEFLDEVQLLSQYDGKKILIIPSNDSIINKEYVESLSCAKIHHLEGNHVLTLDNPEALNKFLSGEFAKFRQQIIHTTIQGL